VSVAKLNNQSCFMFFFSETNHALCLCQTLWCLEVTVVIMFEFVTSFLPWPFRCQGTGDEETGGDGLISSGKLERSNYVWICGFSFYKAR